MFFVRKIILLAGLAVVSMPASADLFIYQTPDGSRMLTDHLLSDPNYRLIRSSQANHGAGIILAGRSRQFFRIDPRAYDNLIARMAKAHDVDGWLIKAVIFVESKFNPYATSSKGAAGLMQLMPATADEYGVDNVYDPAQNIEAGVFKPVSKQETGNRGIQRGSNQCRSLPGNSALFGNTELRKTCASLQQDLQE